MFPFQPSIFLYSTTLESVIDVGQGINVGPGKFVKMQIMLQKTCKTWKKYVGHGKNSKFNKRGAFNKAVEPGKKIQN